MYTYIQYGYVADCKVSEKEREHQNEVEKSPVVCESQMAIRANYLHHCNYSL